jgi:CheY-like chemotaxis protein
MLIEDDVTMLALLGTLLEIEGFTVLKPADDQRENVIAALRLEKPEVALMDVHLRLFNGLELVSSLSQDPELAHTRFIISSGMDLQKEAADSGAAAFLLKPYMPDDLISLIHKVSG